MIVLGGGGLGIGLGTRYSTEPIPRIVLDFTDLPAVQAACNQFELVEDRRMIITSGVFHSDDPSTMMLVNYVAPALIINHLRNTWLDGKIIMVSSISSRWRSWPEIANSRVFYNNTKHAISEYVAAINQQTMHPVRVGCIEPGRFQSEMSNYRGMPLDRVISAIDFMLNQPQDAWISHLELKNQVE